MSKIHKVTIIVKFIIYIFLNNNRHWMNIMAVSIEISFNIYLLFELKNWHLAEIDFYGRTVSKTFRTLAA